MVAPDLRSATWRLVESDREREPVAIRRSAQGGRARDERLAMINKL